MGWAVFWKFPRYRVPIVGIVVMAAILMGVAWMLKPSEVDLFDHIEYDIDPYSYYFRMPSGVQELEGLDAYPLVTMEIGRINSIENPRLGFIVFTGNLTAFDMIHDPAGLYCSTEYSLSHESGTTTTGFQRTRG